MKKIALFAFNGDPVCFIHVLLNALDLSEKGHEIKLIMEGSSVKLIPMLENSGSPLHGLYVRVREAGLIDAVCRACAMKLEVLEEAEKYGLPVKGSMSGHPSMADYMGEGFEIITF